MMEKIPEGPFIIPPYSPEYGGVDFLGLRQVNLNYMGNCLPGINNVTRYIRPFSLISWMYWKVHELVKSEGKVKVKSDVINEFCEKVETLFTWGHILNETRGIPGVLSKPPKGKKVSLLFKDWHRTKQNTSIMAAVNYGPASKTLGGLKFVEPVPVARNIHRTCLEGINLATALDSRLKKTSSYKILEDLDNTLGTSTQAEELYKVWNILTPTKAEKEAFIRAFYDASKIGEDSLLGRRSTTLELALRVLKNNTKSMMLDDLRVGMAYGYTGNLKKIPLNTPLKDAQLDWLLLQVRQAQRYAFECLFAWIEMQIIDESLSDMESIVKNAIKSIEKSKDIIPTAKRINQMYRSMFSKYNDLNELIDDTASNDMACVFSLIYSLSLNMDENRDEVVPLSLRIIMLCILYTKLFKDSNTLRDEISWGGTDRISLAHLSSMLDNCEEMALDEFLLYFFENFILSQHFAIAAGRYDGTTQRLRITIEEDGLQSLVGAPWRPGITSDRLGAAMSLLGECDMVHYDISNKMIRIR